MRIPPIFYNDNLSIKFGNDQICKENFKSTYLLKNHFILNEDELAYNEIRCPIEERHFNQLERNSRKSSVGEDKEKIINFLSDNPDNGAFFSISMSIYSLKSLEDRKSNLVKRPNLKKYSDNILEEMNEVLEQSPNKMDIVSDKSELKNHFDFSKE